MTAQPDFYGEGVCCGWHDYLVSVLKYQAAQTAQVPKTLLLAIYRDSRHSQCLALVLNSTDDSTVSLLEVAERARQIAAELVVVGTPDSYTIYQVGPYSLIPAPETRFPSWIPGFRRRELLPKMHTLLPFRDEEQLRKAFATCHDVIYTDTAKDPAAAFDLLSLVIAAKVLDETGKGESYEFAEIEGEHDTNAVSRIRRLLEAARVWLANGDLDASDLTPVPRLDPRVVTAIVRQLQDYSLTLTGASPVGTDLLGVAYEQLVGSTFRGELGSYFTPRNLADFMVRLLDISSGRVFDPSCGSGGLLIAAHRHASAKACDLTRLDLYGNDLNPRMVEAAKVNFLVHGVDPSHVLHGDGLDLPRIMRRWFGESVQTGVPYWDGQPGEFDFVLANPPFAGHEKNDSILRHFSTAYRADGSIRSLNKTLPFLELILASLRDGGRAGIVLPTSILNAEEESFVRFREALLERAELVAIIGLPERAFVHTDCGVHGALLFFERRVKPRQDYDVFVAWADELGYDRLGKPTRKNDFPQIVQRFHSGEWSAAEKVSLRDLRRFQRWDPTWLRFARTLPQGNEDGHVPLSDLVEVRNARWSRKQLRENEAYRYFEVVDADLLTGEIKAVQEATGFELMKKGRIRNRVRAGDILLPNHRDSLMATSAVNGRSVVVVPNDLDGVLTTDRFMVLRPKIDPALVVALLNSRGVRRQLVAQCRGAASLDIREHTLSKVLIPKQLLEPESVGGVQVVSERVASLRDQLRGALNELSLAVEGPFGCDEPIRPKAATR